MVVGKHKIAKAGHWMFQMFQMSQVRVSRNFHGEYKIDCLGMHAGCDESSPIL